MTQILFFGVLIGAFYLLIIRPQQQQRAKHQKMMSELRPGRRIVTIGGIHGEILEVEDEDIRVEVADGIVMLFSRAAVARFEDEGEVAAVDAGSEAEVSAEDAQPDESATGEELSAAGESEDVAEASEGPSNVDAPGGGDGEPS